MAETERVLIVDDTWSTLSTLRQGLAETHSTYQVETASSGEEALFKLAFQPFDTVITDLTLPGLDGLELLKRIRAIHPQVRVILMSASDPNVVGAYARRLGVYRYVVKTYGENDLLQAIRLALGEPAARARQGGQC